MPSDVRDLSEDGVLFHFVCRVGQDIIEPGARVQVLSVLAHAVFDGATWRPAKSRQLGDV